VSGGRSLGRFGVFPPDDFPVFRVVDTSATRFQIPAAALAHALRFTLPCVSTEHTRQHLCGCFMHEIDGFITMVATDSHRLAVCRAGEGPPIPPVIIPSTVTERLVGLLRATTATVFCAISEYRVEFCVDDAVLTAKLIDGTFPTYSGVVAPRRSAPLVVDRSALIEATKRISVVCGRGGTRTGVRLRSTGQTLQLSAGEPPAEIIDEIDVAGPELEIGVQIRYLDGALSVINAEQVELHIRDAASPMRVCARGMTDDAVTIMPLRI
jgi:DNA polymerase-3 subunit beta